MGESSLTAMVSEASSFQAPRSTMSSPYSSTKSECVIGSHVIMANCATLGGHVLLDDWVGMGGFSAVHQFCKIGAHAYLANNAAVTGDVPPYVMAVGRPAEPHSVNSEGLKRRGFSPEQIRNIREAYRVLYRSDLLLADATEKLQASPLGSAATAEAHRSSSRAVGRVLRVEGLCMACLLWPRPSRRSTGPSPGAAPWRAWLPCPSASWAS